jgi:hypothetical protein
MSREQRTRRQEVAYNRASHGRELSLWASFVKGAESRSLQAEFHFGIVVEWRHTGANFGLSSFNEGQNDTQLLTLRG